MTTKYRSILNKTLNSDKAFSNVFAPPSTSSPGFRLCAVFFLAQRALGIRAVHTVTRRTSIVSPGVSSIWQQTHFKITGAAAIDGRVFGKKALGRSAGKGLARIKVGKALMVTYSCVVEFTLDVNHPTRIAAGAHCKIHRLKKIWIKMTQKKIRTLCGVWLHCCIG